MYYIRVHQVVAPPRVPTPPVRRSPVVRSADQPHYKDQGLARVVDIAIEARFAFISLMAISGIHATTNIRGGVRVK